MKLHHLFPDFISKKLEERKGFRNILANVGWLLTERVFRTIIGFFVLIWLARYLGPQQLGILNYATAYVALFAVLIKLGLERIVIRDIVSNPEKSNEILGASFVLKFFGGLVSFLSAFIIIKQLRPNDLLVRAIVVIIASGALLQIFYVIDFWFQAQVKSKYVVNVRNTVIFLGTLCKIVLILARAPLIAFAVVILGEDIFEAIGLILVYNMNGGRIRELRFSFKRAKIMLQESWPLLFSGLAITVYKNIDQVMLGEMIGEKAVGIYGIAVKCSEFWYVIPTAIVSSCFPAIIESKKKGEELYYRRLKQLFSVVVLISYMIAIPFMFFSNFIIKSFFGDQFSGAGAILAIHIWSGTFVFLGIARESWIVTEGLMKFAMVSTILGALSNVILNLLLIPGYSGIGAAIATLISYSLAGYLSCFFYSKTRHVGALMTEALFFPWRNLVTLFSSWKKKN